MERRAGSARRQRGAAFCCPLSFDAGRARRLRPPARASRPRPSPRQTEPRPHILVSMSSRIASAGRLELFSARSVSARTSSHRSSSFGWNDLRLLSRAPVRETAGTRPAAFAASSSPVPASIAAWNLASCRIDQATAPRSGRPRSRGSYTAARSCIAVPRSRAPTAFDERPGVAPFARARCTRRPRARSIGSAFADEERQALDRVVQVCHLRAGELREEIGHVVVDGVSAALALADDPGGELAAVEGLALDDEPLLLRHRRELPPPVDLPGHDDEAGRVDRRGDVRRIRRSSGDCLFPSSSPSSEPAPSQRSAERTSTNRRGAIIGTVRAAATTLLTSTSPAVKRSSLNAATPPPSAAARSSATT